MPIDRDIQSMVRKEAANVKSKLTADELFTSSVYVKHTQNLVDTTTGKYETPVELNLYHGELNGDTACTDGRKIIQNTHNRLVYSYESLLNKYLAQVGMTMHEVAHILFCNFDEDKKAIECLKAGMLYGEEPIPDTPEEEDTLAEMLDALATEEYRPIFTQIYHDVANIIDDPHDEDKLIDAFGGFVEQSILIVREALRMGITSLEDMMKVDGASQLQIVYSLMLQFARFGEIVSDDIDAAYKLEPMKKLLQLALPLELARYTDDPMVKAEQINKIMLFLWPYIKEEIDNLEKQQNQQERDSQDQDSQESQGQQDSQGQQGQNSQNSQGGQQGSQSQNSQGGQQNSQSQGNQGQQNPQNQGGQGIAAPSQSTIQQVLNQLEKGTQNSGQTQAAENGRTSSTAKKNAKAAKAGEQEEKSSSETPQNAPTNAEAGQEVLDSLIESLAQAEAQENVSQDITSQLKVKVNAVSQNSTHKGRKTTIEPQTDVSDSDKKLYDKLMADLTGYSKRLQRQMTNALRDLKDGSIAHHRAFGNKFEANAAYRPDQKYYAKKKLPQDLPDMAIALTIDHSGSMMGERLLAAMKASMLLYDFATKLDIPVFIAGHNTTDSGIRYYTYTGFRKVSDSEKYRLAKMVAGSCNRDGMAIEITSSLLAKRPEEVKLHIIISDGQPNDTGYGGDEAAKDIADIVKKYRKQGIETIAAAIGSDKDQIKAIYGEGSFLNIENLETLPKTLVALVRKRIIA